MRRALIAVVLAAMPACSLFVDLSDLSNGSVADVDGGDASFLDAPADARSDASTLADAAAADATSLGFCASHSPAPLFCADFDDGYDGGAVPPPWTDYEGLDDGGTALTLDDTEAKSPPFSLYAYTHGGSDGADVYAKVAPFASAAHLEADVFVEAKPSAGAIAPLSLAVELPPNDHYALLYFSANDVYLQNGDSTGATSILAQRHAPITPGWHHAALDVKLEGVASTMSVALDGVAFGTDVPMTYAFAGMTHTYVYVGAVGVYQADPFAVRVDNVLLDAR